MLAKFRHVVPGHQAAAWSDVEICFECDAKQPDTIIDGYLHRAAILRQDAHRLVCDAQARKLVCVHAQVLNAARLLVEADLLVEIVSVMRSRGA